MSDMIEICSEQETLEARIIIALNLIHHINYGKFYNGYELILPVFRIKFRDLIVVNY